MIENTTYPVATSERTNPFFAAKAARLLAPETERRKKNREIRSNRLLKTKIPTHDQ